jgi:hypothetical protein
MFQVIVALCVAGLSQWAFSAVDDGGEEKKVHARVMIFSGEDGEQTEVKIAGDCEGTAFVWVSDDEESGAGQSDEGDVKRIVKIFRHGGDSAPQDPDRGWLGVSIGRVHEAGAAQADVAGKGIVVLKVMPDSPAEAAGMKDQDIIVAVGGVALDGTVGHGVEIIGEHKPGETVSITVLRDGDEQTFTVTLGTKADIPGFNWIMKLPSSGEIEEEIITHGRMLHRGEDGEWTFEDLGDLAQLKNLPADILRFIPKAGSRTFHISNDDSKKTVRCTVQKDGSVLVIEQEDGGEIVVTRTDGNGVESTTTYATAEEMRDADLEAYDYFNDAGHHFTVDLNFEGSDGFLDLSDLSGRAVIELDLDLGDLHEHLADWGVNLSEGVENYELHLDSLREVLENLKTLPEADNLTRALKLKRFDSKPRHTFEVRTDGTIEARIRRGDSELVRLFEDEADLLRRNPELFQKFEDLTAVEE